MNDGILIVDKPEGLTSHDVVARLRRILKTKKIGHTGTLDPFATGVLVMLVGKATRLAQFLDKDEKSYKALVRFGFETDTGDRTGKIKNKSKKADVKKEEIAAVLPAFTGQIEQVPPMYSAKKVKGKKLYELARQGIEIERKAVNVKISDLHIMDRSESADSEDLKSEDSGLWTQDFELFVTCSAGTYIRTLAEEIGRKVGVLCHLAQLRRTRAGAFDISQAVTLEELEQIVEENKLDEILIPMNQAVSHLPEKKLDPQELKRVQNGMQIKADIDKRNVREVRLTNADNDLVAIGNYERDEQKIQPRIVFLN